jgi:hypothetical protein
MIKQEACDLVVQTLEELVSTMEAMLKLVRNRAVHVRTLCDRGNMRALPMQRAAHTAAEMKAQQSSKIREIGDALVAAGFCALDEQAEALGLSRSTTWTMLKGNYKNSGLSAATLKRILSVPRLPPIVRAKVHEYIEEKTAGLYGDSKTRLRKFAATLHPPTPTKHRR